MAGDLLRDFDSATVFQIRRDPSRPEEETFILWGLLGLAGTLPCGAQITGTITGSVVDVTSSLVQKATVVVKNLGTGAERQLVTDSGGRFTAEQLPVGSYEVTVTASGFKKAVRTGLELNVTDRLGVEFRLEVGQISETISVTAEAPLVKTETGDVSYLISEKQITELSITNRTFMALQQLIPGASRTAADELGISFSSGNAPARAPGHARFFRDVFDVPATAIAIEMVIVGMMA